jgi:taurine dioxygenase
MTLTLATTSERQAAGPIEVIPTGRALGAELRGIVLRELSEAAFARLMQAWHQHSVVLVRDQRLSDQELIAFSRRLGISTGRRSRKPADVSSRACRRFTSYPTSR